MCREVAALQRGCGLDLMERPGVRRVAGTECSLSPFARQPYPHRFHAEARRYGVSIGPGGCVTVTGRLTLAKRDDIGGLFRRTGARRVVDRGVVSFLRRGAAASDWRLRTGACTPAGMVVFTPRVLRDTRTVPVLMEAAAWSAADLARSADSIAAFASSRMRLAFSTVVAAKASAASSFLAASPRFSVFFFFDAIWEVVLE